MTLDPRTWDTDHWSLAVAIIGLIIALPGTAGFFAFLLQWRKDSEERLKENPRLRGEWVARLRSGSPGALYRLALGRALDRLDGWFGAPGSARAWGVCVLVAVAYSWVTFFVGWGVFGASGEIGGVGIMPKAEGSWALRGIVLVWMLGVPPLSFFIAKWLARWLQTRERRGQAWLLRRWLWPRRWGRRAFHRLWRLLIAGLISVGIIWAEIRGGKMGDFAFKCFFCGTFPLLGILAARWVSRRIRQDWLVYPVGFLVGAITIAIAIALATSLGGAVGANAEAAVAVGAVALSLAGAGAGTWPVVGAAVGAAVQSLIEEGAGAGFIIIAGAFSVSVGTIFGLIGTNRDRRYIWPGALGGIVGFGMIAVFLDSKYSHSVLAIVLFLFFLILPLLNSLFDWLSWWATRALGRRLLAVLDPAGSFWPRLRAVLGHGVLDLGAAVLLLLSMAFALGLGFQVYNDLALLRGEAAPFDLPALIHTVQSDPFHEGFWFTLMLLTTLLPTFGHGIMLLGAPVGLLLVPNAKRLALADELEYYDAATDGEQADIRQRAARWHVQERIIRWLLAGLLFTWLLLRVGLLVPLGLTDWAASWALGGVTVAGWLVGTG